MISFALGFLLGVAVGIFVLSIVIAAGASDYNRWDRWDG